MLKLLHISDLHFGPHYLPVTGESLLRIAEKLAPDVIVASGDFTQRAKPQQFEQARAYLQRLPAAPLIVTPGNHDIPLYRVLERLRTPYDLYRQFISPELESTLTVPGAVFAAINTTNPLRRITDGRLHAAQFDYCAAAFRAAHEGDLRVLVAHHPVAAAPDFVRKGVAMRGAAAALDRFAAMKVDLILGGHLHRAYIGNSLDICPHSGHAPGIVIVQSGTSTSLRGRARERQKNSFNVIEVTGSEIRVTHYLFFHESGGFRPIGEHAFPRRGRDYLDEPQGKPQ
jgi:3',5'-cyclic AMP phosphodiesterase CpdA